MAVKRNNKITNVFSVTLDDPLTERLGRELELRGRGWYKTKYIREALEEKLDRDEQARAAVAKPNGKKKRRRA